MSLRCVTLNMGVLRSIEVLRQRVTQLQITPDTKSLQWSGLKSKTASFTAAGARATQLPYSGRCLFRVRKDFGVAQRAGFYGRKRRFSVAGIFDPSSSSAVVLILSSSSLARVFRPVIFNGYLQCGDAFASRSILRALALLAGLRLPVV